MSRCAIAFALTLALGACQKSEPAPASSLTLFAFGTTMTLTISAAAAKRDNLQRELTDLVAARHREWHAWERGPLTELNRALARGDTADTTPSIAMLIARGQQLSSLSGGRFDPGVGTLIARWGFHSSAYPIVGPAPDPLWISAWRRQHAGIAQLRLNGHRVEPARAGVQLDFGGLAKGALSAEIAQMLRRRGVCRALLELGGDVSALTCADDRPWRVGVRDPNGGVALGGVELRDGESLFTSGTYARFRAEDHRAAHILDPRAGAPARGLRSASVLVSDPWLADAAATALVVAGAEWRTVATQMAVDAVLVIDDTDRCLMSAAMAARWSSNSNADLHCLTID